MAIWKKILTEEAIATSTSLGTSNDLVPSQGAVKSYVDTEIGGVSTTLVDLTDTTITSIGDHDIIAYDSGTSKYINMTAAEAGLEETITGAATTITSSNLTASRALISNASGKISATAITSTELIYLDGVTANIQTQLDGKAATNGDSSEDFDAKDITCVNLEVTGTNTVIDTTNLNVEDKLITISKNSTTESASADSGLHVETGQTWEPHFTWTNDSVANNNDGCIGTGWKMNPTVEAPTANTFMHVMGFKTAAGAPNSSDSSSASTKAEGAGVFYWDSTNDEMYICTNSDSSNSSGN